MEAVKKKHADSRTGGNLDGNGTDYGEIIYQRYYSGDLEGNLLWNLLWHGSK